MHEALLVALPVRKLLQVEPLEFKHLGLLGGAGGRNGTDHLPVGGVIIGLGLCLLLFSIASFVQLSLSFLTGLAGLGLLNVAHPEIETKLDCTHCNYKRGTYICYT